ncbi:MAG TPA: TlpA disulfide reductase family protein [Bryobacteraceae bacterium]|nr:TlpA disulfide reductase family protein [Bryobacteraceae bacterium]
MRAPLLPLLLASALSLLARSLPVQIGETPPLAFGTVLQGPPVNPANRALVVEFWATWCIPCRESIPHLNQLASEFRAEPVDFISLSDEPATQVRAFLASHPILGTVATDPQHRMQAQFAIPALPTTVLIYPDGTLAAVALPGSLTRERLHALLRSDRLDVSDIRFPDPLQSSGAQQRDAVHVQLNPGFGPNSFFIAPNHYRGTGVELKRLLSFAYEIPLSRIVVSRALERMRYHVDISVPAAQQDALRALLKAVLLAGTPVDVSLAERTVEAVVIHGNLAATPKPALKEGLRVNCPSGSIVNGTIADLQGCIEDALLQPVIIEDARPGYFEFNLRWQPGSSQSLLQELEQTLKISIRREPRKMTILTAARVPFPAP